MLDYSQRSVDDRLLSLGSTLPAHLAAHRPSGKPAAPALLVADALNPRRLAQIDASLFRQRRETCAVVDDQKRVIRGPLSRAPLGSAIGVLGVRPGSGALRERTAAVARALVVSMARSRFRARKRLRPVEIEMLALTVPLFGRLTYETIVEAIEAAAP